MQILRNTAKYFLIIGVITTSIVGIAQIYSILNEKPLTKIIKELFQNSEVTDTFITNNTVGTEKIDMNKKTITNTENFDTDFTNIRKLILTENVVIKQLTKTVCASDSLDASQCDYTCDGTADDVQIQAAIAAVNTAGGGSIRIVAGNYSNTSAISLTGMSNIELNFEKDAKIVLTGSDNIIEAINTSGNEESGLIVRGAYLEGQAIETSGNGIHFEYVDNSYIYNTEITKCGTGADGAGIYFNYCDYNTIDGSILNANRNGYLSPQNSAPVTISLVIANTIAKNNSDDGFHPERDYSTRIENCQAYSNGETGIDLWNSLYATISNCKLTRNTKRGVEIANGTSNATVIGNEIRDNIMEGIYIGDAATNHYNTITDNEIKSNGRDGILITQKAEDTLIIRNVIKNNDNGSGIIILGSSTSLRTRIIDNFIHTNGKYGIWIQTVTNGNEVINNHLIGNGNDTKDNQIVNRGGTLNIIENNTGF